MISDESSSDSETGRFKGRSKTQDDNRTSNQKADNVRDSGRSRQSGPDRFNRKREERPHTDRHSRDRDRDRHRYSRHSPISRRRHSRDRSPTRRSHERNRRERDSSEKSKLKEHRSSSRHRYSGSASKSHITQDSRKEKDVKDEIRLKSDHKKSSERSLKKIKERSASPVHKGKKSEIYRPPPAVTKQKSDSPVIVEVHNNSDGSEEVQPGSYYNMIPAVVKEKTDESSEIDSSDDERLRAKLLNLEKELQKTKKKKHKKKHKRKSSKSSKDREKEASVSVEVSSTTDIDIKTDIPQNPIDAMEEVTSTQKSAQKESCEEGEISSDDSQSEIEIDPTDLRHKLRRTVPKTVGKELSAEAADVCGPALPPHLEKRYERSTSPNIEGPALPPHLKGNPKNIGPSIPDDMRKVLAEKEREVIIYESSDEDLGIGPLPTGSEEKWSDAHRRLEERALDIKIKNLDRHSDTSKMKSREQWMLELPEGKAKIIGLEARSFRAKEGPDMSDRSQWTDTPEDKARKAAGQVKEEDIELSLKQEAKMRHIANRDEEQELAVKKHKKKHKREESLLDMHQKKLKKKKKKDEKEDGKKERRPFSRDVDLQVNRFDEAQKKSIIKKAQDLDGRFGRGEAKYL